ncbi:MAG: RNA polymerase sigma factor, partial [Verrucomicrobiales bacterium]|nr:RNA polymerase sigma factor [Verrucomicrobiales bacterium]
LRVYRHRNEYDPARPFRIWLFTIAANLGRNVLRARRRFLRISLHESAHGPDSPTVEEILSADAPSPDVSAERREVRNAVRVALDKLSPDLRTTVELVDLLDLSTREAAIALRVPERTVESRLYHGRRKLRQFLARWFRRVVSATPMLSGA